MQATVNHHRILHSHSFRSRNTKRCGSAWLDSPPRHETDPQRASHRGWHVRYIIARSRHGRVSFNQRPLSSIVVFPRAAIVLLKRPLTHTCISRVENTQEQRRFGKYSQTAGAMPDLPEVSFSSLRSDRSLHLISSLCNLCEYITNGCRVSSSVETRAFQR